MQPVDSDAVKQLLWLLFFLLNTNFLTGLSVADINAAFTLSGANTNTSTSTDAVESLLVEGEFEFRQAAYEPQAGWAETTTLDGETLYLAPTASLTSEDVASVSAQTDPLYNGQITLLFRFTDAGAEKMAALSGEQIGQPLAIMLNGEVILSPTIYGVVSNEAQIQSAYDFTPDLLDALGLTPEDAEALKQGQ